MTVKELKDKIRRGDTFFNDEEVSFLINEIEILRRNNLTLLQQLKRFKK